MKNFLFALILIAINVTVNGQELAFVKQYQTVGTQENYNVQRVFFNKKIPSIPIEDINGNYSTLDTYIRKNRKFPDKPTLLITSYSFCGGCIKEAKRLYEEGLSGKYNLIILYESFNNKTEKSLTAFINSFQLGKEFPDFLIVRSNQKISHKFLSLEATPLYLVCDADLKPVYSSLGYESTNVPVIMNLLDKKLISREKISYNKSGKVVANNDRTAYYSHEIAEKENNILLTTLIDNKVESRYNYLLKDGKFLNDGLNLENDISYAKDSSLILKERKRVFYKEGRPTEDRMIYHQNGQKEMVWPLNGALQAFDEEGQLKIDGKTKNGLAEGVFKYYTDNKITWAVTYTSGIKNGPYKNYEKGDLKITGFYRDNEKDGLELEYNDGGSVISETYRSNKYDYISKFSEGLAFVKLDEKYGYINRTGSEVINLLYDDAKTFGNGKAKVSLNGKEIYIDIMGREIKSYTGVAEKKDSNSKNEKAITPTSENSSKMDYSEEFEYIFANNELELLFIDSYDTCYARGMKNYREKEYNRAIKCFDKAVFLSKSVSVPFKLFLNRGFAEYMINDYNAAIADFDKVIALEPKNSEAFLFRGTSKNALNDYGGAMADHNKSIELNPNYSDAYLSRGFIKYSLKDYRGAMTDFKKAIDTNAKNPLPYYWLGRSKIELGQKDSGCLDLSKAGELGYKDAYDAISKFCK